MPRPKAKRATAICAAILLIAILLAGCATSPPNTPPQPAQSPATGPENPGQEKPSAQPPVEDVNENPAPVAAQPAAPNDTNGAHMLVANWNLQIFGKAKADRNELMEYYAGKIRDYNIIIVQEIRDQSGTAFPKLCALLPEYKCIVSSPVGRSVSKEQYGVIYKDAQLLSQKDYSPDRNADFERPPFAVVFRYGDWNFTIVTIHTKPEDVKNELAKLQELADQIGGEAIIMGDLNADCNYYNEEKNPELDLWNWAIPNTEDTTVAKTDCAYDRIIYNNAVKDNFIKYGVMRDVNAGESDHYLVWGEFRAG